MIRMSAALVRRLLVVFLALAWTARAAHGQTPTFTPFHEDGVYAEGEKVGWIVAAPADGSTRHETYRYTIKTNNLETIKSGLLEFADGRGTIETKLDEPGMIYVRVTADDTTQRAITLGAAVGPTHLRPSAPRPADFDAFWDQKLRDLRDIPMVPVLAPRETSAANVDLFAVTLASLGSKVHGYLARPSREGRFPALVIFQYAGVYALQPKTVTDRALEGWLAFDVSSHDMEPDQAVGVSQKYFSIGNTDRETSYFLKMYLRDSRAIDYIASRPDWDGKTIVVMGTSMGGQQSLVTAGLNPKITAVIVNEPAGADSNGDLHGRKAGYPNWPSDDPAVMQTALYFDTVNFASRIRAPTLVALGFVDTIAPPVGIWIAWNQIPAPKEIVTMIDSDHNNITPEKQGAYEARWREVLHGLLANGTFEPRQTLSTER